MLIRRTDKSLIFIFDGQDFVTVFTDGSACCTSSEWLCHGGYGVHNYGAGHHFMGALVGLPCTSYRAEGRALLEAITRAAVPLCIVCDNLSAVRNLSAILATKGDSVTWRPEDECADYWTLVARHLRSHPEIVHVVRWIPSHMDDPKRSHIKHKFLEEGGIDEWITRNQQADKLAEEGAKTTRRPQHLMTREKLLVLLARATQRMFAHVWAVHQDYVKESKAPAKKNSVNEEYIPDTEFGLPDHWEEVWDPHQDDIPDDVWLGGIFEDSSSQNDCQPCGFDDPDADAEWNCPARVTEGCADSSHEAYSGGPPGENRSREHPRVNAFSVAVANFYRQPSEARRARSPIINVR